MTDTPPSATPMPVPPVDTVTSTEAPFPPAAPPLPVFVPPSVTDPVSNLDLPPVDDAFALEMRAATIEQLAGGGSDGEGGARTPSPAPAPAAGDAGTQAASETLSAATGAGGTAQAGGMAGVRSQDLTGIHRGDEVAALARETNVPGAYGDLTGLRRGTDTAGQLAALRDAMRGTDAGAQGEVRSVSRVSKPGDTASVHEASALDIVAHIRSGATAPEMDVPVSHSAVSPPQPPPGMKLRLLGGADGLPLLRRIAIAEQFGSEAALRYAEFVLHGDSADALGWSGARVWAVLADLYRLNATVYWHFATIAASVDIDWNSIDALGRILDAPPSP